METSTINSVMLESKLLSMSFGGVMYNVTEGCEMVNLVNNNKEQAQQLISRLEGMVKAGTANGIEKGLLNYVKDVLNN